jgi:hypothetical protein
MSTRRQSLYPWPWSSIQAAVADGAAGCRKAESQHQQNGWLVRQMAEALRRPLSASISDDFRGAISSGDDLNLYPKGIEATAYGISGCPTTYHTMKDDVDPPSLLIENASDRYPLRPKSLPRGVSDQS